MATFFAGERVTSASSGKSGHVVDRDDSDRVYVRFDDGSYGELPEEQIQKGPQQQQEQQKT